MALKDIEKLKEKVDKDPKSKLFVPLAEEYRKEGMLDQAIDVLLSGIERQPSYMSARVSLGKIYLEKGMVEEARKEFENVIRSIPDNLYAHKKLAEIYRDTGEREMAIKAYKTVLKLNPMDEEALNSLRDIETSTAESVKSTEPLESVPPETEEVLPPEAEKEDFFEEKGNLFPTEEVSVTEPQEETVEETFEDVEDISAFSESLFGKQSIAAEEIQEEHHEETIEIVNDSGLKEEQITDIQLSEEEISFGDVSEDTGIQFDEIVDIQQEEEMVDYAEDAFVYKDQVAEPAKSADLLDRLTEKSEETVQDADRLISEGNYAGAFNLYRRLLQKHPENRQVLQRIEELKFLLRLTGKNRDVLIQRLDTFIEAIKKRRDEFFRSS